MYIDFVSGTSEEEGEAEEKGRKKSGGGEEFNSRKLKI